LRHTTAFIFLLVLALVKPPVSAADEVALVVGGGKIFLHTPPVFVDGSVYAPLAALDAVGAKCETDSKHKRDGQKVKITSAGGKKFSCRARLVGDELMLPIRDIAPELGAVADWDEVSRILSLRARIESIAFDGSELRVTTSYPVTYADSWWNAKLILDLHGVQMPARQSDLPIENSTAIAIRTGSHDNGETGRIVLDLPKAVEHKVKSARKTSKIAVSISGLRPADLAGVIPEGRVADEKAPPVGQPPQAETKPPVIELPPVSVTDIGCRKHGRRAEVRVSMSGPAKYLTSMTRQPDRFVVDIANAVLAREFDDMPVGHELLQGIRVGQFAEKAVRIVMDLTRIAAPDVEWDEASGSLVISLRLPKNAGGSLADKIVVIDPGHGGKDPGAGGCDGQWQEKNSNLAIALCLQKALSDMGVCALMTRKTDVRLGSTKTEDLNSRAAFARRHSADLFVSIHGNSVSGPRSPSGIETYYHGREASSMALAYCVHSEVITVADLPDLKVKSDFRLYQTGLGILRRVVSCGIPAMLIELGFVKHPVDLAKLKDPNFQQEVAEAVVRGLRTYVEGNSSSLRQSGNPESPPSEPITDAESAVEPPAETHDAPKQTDKPATEPQKPTSTTGPHRPGEAYK